MMNTHRFFVCQSDAVCEQIRATLDAAWGHPNEHTQTCFLPAAMLEHDRSGRPMLIVDSAFCEYEAVAAMLPGLLAGGAVWEITRDQYREAAMPGPGE